MEEINGKVYPLWQQFVDKKENFIGKKLIDYGDSFVKDVCETTITDIKLVPNGHESAAFFVVGEDFSCGFDVRYGGIEGKEKAKEDADILFGSLFGHQWGIK
jgi:hypothetical protein